MALPISRLAQLNASQKKEFLKHTAQMIDDLANTPLPDNRIDLY